MVRNLNLDPIRAQGRLKQVQAIKTSAIGEPIPPPGGWQPLEDVKDPHVQELGKFAVSEHNKEAKVDLQFGEVKKGEFEVVSGTLYRLLITATNHGNASDYNVDVYEENRTKIKMLTSFTKA
ncbi:cysteine proteinase inhibitor 1-like [Macadamia integrifolia]|uniref:cysteine proteinase inhibitor 1-like n=1 Tax=Macadamia integrifolia TaxID=60698 RepID=UPI001C53099C|nr:cysteine proteinase inhibitor 1-like [Macadamia integrifolia]